MWNPAMFDPAVRNQLFGQIPFQNLAMERAFKRGGFPPNAPNAGLPFYSRLPTVGGHPCLGGGPHGYRVTPVMQSQPDALPVDLTASKRSNKEAAEDKVAPGKTGKGK